MADTTVVLRQQARDQYDILASEQHPADANALYDAWMDDVNFPEGTSQFAGLRDLAVASGAELRFARGGGDGDTGGTKDSTASAEGRA